MRNLSNLQLIGIGALVLSLSLLAPTAEGKVPKKPHGWRGQKESLEHEEAHRRSGSKGILHELRLKDDELLSLHRAVKQHFLAEDEDLPTHLDEEPEKHEFNGIEDFDEREATKFISYDSISKDNIQSSVTKREFGITRTIAVGSNGTKYYSKIRKAGKVDGTGKTSIDGSVKTGLTSVSSFDANFDINVTSSTKESETKTRVPGDVQVTLSSNTKFEDGMFISTGVTSSKATMVPETKPSIGSVSISSMIESRSESYFVPFGTMVTYFNSGLSSNTSWNGGSSKSHGAVIGDVTSSLVFTRNGTSMSRVKVKAYGRVTTGTGETQISQGFVVKSKVRVWSRRVHAGEDEDSNITLDIFSKSETKVYGKASLNPESVIKEVYSASGEVSWKKSRIVIPKSGGDLNSHGHLTHMIHKEEVMNSLSKVDLSSY